MADKTELEGIRKAIRLKKKQGMEETEIIKFLELSGYPLRLLEDVNKESGETAEKEENEEDVNPFVIKISGLLLFITALVEVFYFFLIFPEFDFLKPEDLIIQFGLMVLFALLSALLGFGLYKKKDWGFNYGSTLILLRILLLGYFVYLKYEFFLFLMLLDIVLALIIFMIKPFFSDKKIKSEREKLMDEIEIHKQGKDKKEIWEN